MKVFFRAVASAAMFFLSQRATQEFLLDAAESLAKKTANKFDDDIVARMRQLYIALEKEGRK